MLKAYDRVDWMAFTRILTLFGFSDKIVKLILNCISYVNMELLLNGEIAGKIPMEQGLRQGDPMSPFLFILFSELLSHMLYKWEQEGKIHGVKLGRTAPAISHLMFTDDLLLFYRADLEEVRNIRKCLKLYCRWT